MIPLRLKVDDTLSKAFEFMKKLAALLLFAAILFAHSGPAAAQVQTYYYQGPAWSVSECEAALGSGSPPCINGSVTASVTLIAPANYSGTITLGGVAAYSLSAPGVGVMNSLADLNSVVAFHLSSGQMASWLAFQATHYAGLGSRQITADSDVGSDVAYDSTSGSITSYGLILSPPYGFWLNPKSLGKPWLIAGGCCAGDPIDIGSGNLFEEAQDYATAGQNPLAFTRYYNSMAVPDTYATTLGQNWRTIFDRYLHIINPSAIYGVVAERPDG
jgi:hypothetical protein